MPLAVWIRDRVWPAERWCEQLAQLGRDLAAEPASTRRAQRLLELGAASEMIDPDRGRALELYAAAWRAGHPAAGAPAKRLAAQLHSHIKIAEIALGEGDLLVAGAAFLDAGLPELAADPLQRLVDQRASGHETARALLSLAQRKPFDAEREIDDTLGRARQATGAAAVGAYLHACRIARLANRAERVPAILAAASRACPTSDEISALVELRLLDSGDADALLAHHGPRFERVSGRAEYVERVRAAAIELIAHNVQPGLGLRLLRMSLEHAYAAQVPAITSHIAAWELLLAHATAQKSTLELVPLIVQALAAPLPEDELLYLAQAGLAIVWTDGKDAVAAQPYAAIVLDMVRAHPRATALVAAVGAPAVPASPPRSAPPPAAAPVATASSRPTGRMQSLPDGPVKRSEPAPSAVAHPPRIGGRLALLRPPPPQETALDRDVSPIPEPPRAETPTAPRAPRKIVPVDAVVTLPDGATFSAVLRDLSTSGAFIVTKRLIAIGTLIRLELKIPTRATMMQVRHRVSARVARAAEFGCGVAFVDASAELVAQLRVTTG